MFCGLSIAAPLVLPSLQPGVIHHLAPLLLSSAAVVSPGSRQCRMVAAQPLLVGSEGVQSGSSWTSAVASPRPPSLGLDLWVSCVAPRCVHGASRRKFTSRRRMLFPAVQTVVLMAMWLFLPYCLTGAPFILCFVYFHICLLHFVKCPWVP